MPQNVLLKCQHSQREFQILHTVSLSGDKCWAQYLSHDLLQRGIEEQGFFLSVVLALLNLS